MKQGLFITFEGVDGCGKTTQLERVALRLRTAGYNVVCTREPGGTVLAEKLRSLVLDPSLDMGALSATLLYLAGRAEHLRQVIRPALADGLIVLCDRFSDSTLVYQGYVGGLELKAIEQMNDFATGGLEPDLTLLLDGAPGLLAARRVARGVTDRYEQEGLAFQQQLRSGFLALAQRAPQRVRLVDALLAPEQVEQKLMDAIIPLLDK
ncbi:MAG: dTMP kinase [Acidaminococcaceae bacterium]